MPKPRLIVTRTLPKSVEARLGQQFDVVLNPSDRALSQSALAEAMKTADALLPTISDKIDAQVIGKNPKVKIIANFGVGFNHIDLMAARQAGILVSNTPDVLTDATADLALMLILASTRRARLHAQKLEAGEWQGFKINSDLGMGLQGKTLGIIGMGRIGQATARRAIGFGMDIAYFNRSPKHLDFPAKPYQSIADLLPHCDVLSLHLPGGQGEAIIGAQEFERLPAHAHLINTARGDLVDETALITALAARQIAGAGLDVFAHEPHVPQALIDDPNVVVLPHIGSATKETRTAMGMLAADNLEAYFAGRPCPNLITKD